jgi:hypothetical protein
MGAGIITVPSSVNKGIQDGTDSAASCQRTCGAFAALPLIVSERFRTSAIGRELPFVNVVISDAMRFSILIARVAVTHPNS